MGLIIQIEKGHVRVDYRTAIQRKKRGCWGWSEFILYICYILFIYGAESFILKAVCV